MGALLFAIEEHPDANREEVRNVRTRARKRNTKRKRRWVEPHEDGYEIVGSVQGKSGNPGGLTATGCDTTSSLVQGKSEEARENEKNWRQVTNWGNQSGRAPLRRKRKTLRYCANQQSVVMRRRGHNSRRMRWLRAHRSG